MKREGLALAGAVASWLGFGLDSEQEGQLERYAAWLREEAIPAGALGPREGERLWSRHIADSLALGLAWRGGGPPSVVMDVGSGAGLPGVPLAILWRRCRMILLDRAGRRVRLLRRATRVLELPNLEVEQADVFDVRGEWEGLVFRGSVTPTTAVDLTARLLLPDGRASLALSRKAQLPTHADDLVGKAERLGLAARIELVSPKVLDGPAWVLIIKGRGD